MTRTYSNLTRRTVEGRPGSVPSYQLRGCHGAAAASHDGVTPVAFNAQPDIIKFASWARPGAVYISTMELLCSL